jgi:hypothetical protein
MKRSTQKGYILGIVIIIVFLITIMILSAFSIIMRYMINSKNDIINLDNISVTNYLTAQEKKYDANI